jgi:hypothetical protein
MNGSRAPRGQLDNQAFDIGDSAQCVRGRPVVRPGLEDEAFLTPSLACGLTIEFDRSKPRFGSLMLARRGEAVCSGRMRWSDLVTS